MNTSCPRCRRVIAYGATSHSCGWRASEQTVLPCAFEGCTYPAWLNVQRPEGRANVCKTHYETLASQDAADWCADHGITTPEEGKLFALKTLAARLHVHLPKC